MVPFPNTVLSSSVSPLAKDRPTNWSMNASVDSLALAAVIHVSSKIAKEQCIASYRGGTAIRGAM